MSLAELRVRERKGREEGWMESGDVCVCVVRGEKGGGSNDLITVLKAHFG